MRWRHAALVALFAVSELAAAQSLACELAEDDDAGRRRNALLDYTIPADGEYVILANSYRPEAIGDYTLLLERR